MKTRGQGSAHSGAGEWLWQRLTALYVAAFVLYLVLRFSFAPISDFVAWRAWFGDPMVRIGVAIFVGSILLHAWSGLRSVFMDYLRTLWLRFSALFLVAVALMVLGLWAAQLLLEANA